MWRDQVNLNVHWRAGVKSTLLLHTMSAKPSFLQAVCAPSPAAAPVATGSAMSSFTTSSLSSLNEIRDTIEAILAYQASMKTTPDTLKSLISLVRPDLEPLPGEAGAAAPGFRRGVAGGGGGASGSSQMVGSTRNFSNQGGAGGGAAGGAGNGGWRRMPTAFSSSNPAALHTPFGTSHTRQPPSFAQKQDTTAAAPARPTGRYQSRFKREGAIQDKILNSIIGNKLNTFSPVTYNDVRDFIYQILDSGETDFIRDFVEKVFDKATQEDIYCALFAKLLSEISSRYPIIRTEMANYHTEFLKVFDSVQESKDVEYEVLVRQKQYRMGYGQFMSDLAGLNTLDPDCLYAMVKKILDNIDLFTAQEDKEKTVEEFIDCYVRMMKALKQKNPTFFNSIRADLIQFTRPRILPLIEKTAGPRPSLTNKARFGLMDLRDILSV